MPKKTSSASKTVLLDVGNTSVTYGYYYGARLLDFGSCKYTDIPKKVQKIAKSGRNDSTTSIAISSVVPKISQYLKKKLDKGSCKVWIAGKNLKVPVKHKYFKNNKLGIDRLVNIYGATRIYKPPFLMMDFGTALTADYVSAKGVFEGGMIIPGPSLGFKSLLKEAALIPSNLRIPEKRKHFLGKNTQDCMASGILEGYGSMTDELIQRFRSRYGKKLQVIATGGLAKVIKPFARHLNIVDEKHSIKSLLLLFKAQR